MPADRPNIAWGEVTIDCRDAARIASFWGRLLDAEPQPTRPEGWFFLGPVVTGGPLINFQPVREEKAGKARIHLDLWTDDLGAAVAFVEGLDGSNTGERHTYDSGTVVVMADPEGNEFCLVGSAT